MLDGRIAVSDQVHVHAEQGATFGHHQHVFRTRSSDNLLPLLATGLVVVLHADAALRLDAANMRQRIFIAVDPGIDAGRLCPIDNLAGRKNAGSEQIARLLTLGCGKDHTCRRGWIVERRGAHRQILHQRPVLLRDQVADALRTMRMRVDQSRHDRPAARIDHGRSRGHGDACRRTHCCNPVAFDHDGTVLDRTGPVARHGVNTGAGDGDGPARLVGADRPGKRGPAVRRCEPGCIIRLRRAGCQ